MDATFCMFASGSEHGTLWGSEHKHTHTHPRPRTASQSNAPVLPLTAKLQPAALSCLCGATSRVSNPPPPTERFPQCSPLFHDGFLSISFASPAGLSYNPGGLMSWRRRRGACADRAVDLLCMCVCACVCLPMCVYQRV